MYDFEQSNTVCSNVKGRLKTHLQFWQQIGANSYILDVIEHGYKLPMAVSPSTKFLRNNKSALAHPHFVHEATQKLLVSGCVRETSSIPFVVNPLTVAQNKNDKLRLVLDLRYINPFLQLPHVKFEDWSVAEEYLVRDGYMVNFDLKSGYHHIDIHESFQKYLGFSWSAQGVTRYYIFTVLPFGLSTAGHIFTKVVRCLVRYWRSLSIRIIVYLDDRLLIEKDQATAFFYFYKLYLYI